MNLNAMTVFALTSGLIVLATAVIMVVMGSLMRRQRTLTHASAMDIASLHGVLQAQLAASERAEQQLARLVSAVEALDTRIERLELGGGEPSYGRAIALVQRGGDAEALVRDFGLSKSEAALVSVVHARRAAN